MLTEQHCLKKKKKKGHGDRKKKEYGLARDGTKWGKVREGSTQK